MKGTIIIGIEEYKELKKLKRNETEEHVNAYSTKDSIYGNKVPHPVREDIYDLPFIEINLILKDKLLTDSGWEYTLRDKKKVLQCRQLRFYTTSLEEAVKNINMDQVESFTIAGTGEPDWEITCNNEKTST